MTLGSLMQAATAFVQVQTALNWLADNAPRLADWFASSHRVTQLSDAIDRLQASLGPIGQSETINLGASPDDRVYLRQLNIALYDGRLMIDGAEAVIGPGEKVLLVRRHPVAGSNDVAKWCTTQRMPMNEIAANNALRTPREKSTRSSIASRLSSAMRASGLAASVCTIVN